MLPPNPLACVQFILPLYYHVIAHSDTSASIARHRIRIIPFRLGCSGRPTYEFFMYRPAPLTKPPLCTNKVLVPLGSSSPLTTPPSIPVCVSTVEPPLIDTDVPPFLTPVPRVASSGSPFSTKLFERVPHSPPARLPRHRAHGTGLGVCLADYPPNLFAQRLNST